MFVWWFVDSAMAAAKEPTGIMPGNYVLIVSWLAVFVAWVVTKTLEWSMRFVNFIANKLKPGSVYFVLT